MSSHALNCCKYLSNKKNSKKKNQVSSILLQHLLCFELHYEMHNNVFREGGEIHTVSDVPTDNLEVI